MPDSIRIAVPTQDIAARLAASLPTCNVRVAADDGDWFLEIACDREFNELLLNVLDGTQAYLDGQPEMTLRLEVEGRTYPLRARTPNGGAAFA